MRSLKFCLAVAFVAVLSSCSTSYLTKVGREQWIGEMAKSAIVDGELSYKSRHYLATNALLEEYEDDPQALVKQLAVHLDDPKASGLDIFDEQRATLEALIELCMLLAEDVSDDEAIKYWTSCCYYSYRHLFDPTIKPPLSMTDPLQAAAAYRYYNISASEIFSYLRENAKSLEEEVVLPRVLGKLKLAKPETDLFWKLDQFKKFIVAYDYMPKNFLSHSFNAGIGVPIIGVKEPGSVPNPNDVLAVLKRSCPFTFMLKFDLTTKSRTDLRGIPCYYDAFSDEYVKIDKHRVPLVKDFSIMLGAFLQGSPVISGIEFMFNTEAMGDLQGLYFITPYHPDKIPIVFVHGLMSHPRTWIQVLNHLLGNREIREKYQFWFYAYPTGQPVLYSAFQFRKTLLDIQKKYDPDHANPNFNEMVIIGHSMGGMLTRLAVQSTEGTKLLEDILKLKLDDVELDEEQRQFVMDLLVFDALPFVSRVVFLATPHKGSEMASWSISRFGSSLITLPSRMRLRTQRILDKMAKASGIRDDDFPVEMATGIDNLEPDNLMVVSTCDLPIPDRIVRHSIIGDADEAGHTGGSDGIVPYWSSHRDGAVSELVVKSGHNVQTKAPCAREITRILMEHLRENAKTDK